MTATGTLRLEIDTAAVAERLNAFCTQLSTLPEKAAELAGDVFLRLLDGGALNVAISPLSAATGTDDRVVRLRIVGLDELIAAALRAGEPDFVSHGDSP